jgi:hypothetical protein
MEERKKQGEKERRKEGRMERKIEREGSDTRKLTD